MISQVFVKLDAHFGEITSKIKFSAKREQLQSYHCHLTKNLIFFSGVTTIKVAPAEPFSPFKSNACINSAAPGGVSENGAGNVADPRRVLAALQELSRSRKRGRHHGRQRQILGSTREEDIDEDDDDDDDEDDNDDDSVEEVTSNDVEFFHVFMWVSTITISVHFNNSKYCLK